MNRLSLALPLALAGALLHAGSASAANSQKCVGSARSDAGVAVATMYMEDEQMKSMDLLISLPLQAAPGHAVAEGSDVHVQLDMSLIMGDTQMFDGLGVGLTFLNHKVTGPIDLSVTVDGIEAWRKGMGQNADGTYSARLGKGALKGNVLADALDAATSVRVKVVPSATPDQILANADIPIGTVKQREYLGVTAMDAAAAKAKGKC